MRTLALRWIWNHSREPQVSRMACATTTESGRKMVRATTIKTPCACSQGHIPQLHFALITAVLC